MRPINKGDSQYTSVLNFLLWQKKIEIYLPDSCISHGRTRFIEKMAKLKSCVTETREHMFYCYSTRYLVRLEDKVKTSNKNESKIVFLQTSKINI